LPTNDLFDAVLLATGNRDLAEKIANERNMKILRENKTIPE
jgi:hypothetical protein